MRKISIISMLCSLVILVVSCGESNTKSNTNSNEPAAPAVNADATDNGKKAPDYAIKEVELTNPLDQAMVTEGQGIADMKCLSCHSLEANRLVGPGWKGITTKREPAWIMNMITNVDVMLAEDDEAQKLLEECLVRMPNQNIDIPEARSILEFMRHNDGVE